MRKPASGNSKSLEYAPHQAPATAPPLNPAALLSAAAEDRFAVHLATHTAHHATTGERLLALLRRTATLCAILCSSTGDESRAERYGLAALRIATASQEPHHVDAVKTRPNSPNTTLDSVTASPYGPAERSGGGHRPRARTVVARGRHNRRMSEIFVELGKVNAPPGALVLGMAGWIDQWRELGQPLSERARAAAAKGGGHLCEGLCETVAVPAAADRSLMVRASTSPSPFDREPTVATLEIGLGLPWPETADRAVPVWLGDLRSVRHGCRRRRGPQWLLSFRT
ncbi:hypothetical protein [Streptomyces sp. WAC07149]|uniref:hypothetical protein n=1 Tax=Streptomyces sp. WAC07149 TaxID=2487425 RepID=UPI0021AF90A9|nr:hypothetical protein [Streptomyces sp. WAC07149]